MISYFRGISFIFSILLNIKLFYVFETDLFKNVYIYVSMDIAIIFCYINKKYFHVFKI